MLQEKSLTIEAEIDLVVPSGKPQFQKEDFVNGTAHRLNIFADPEQPWTEQERVEFSVKTYLYLSKLHRKKSYNRIIISDCDGAEPLIVSNLSVFSSVRVKPPEDIPSSRGRRSYALMEEAEGTIEFDDVNQESLTNSWPPDSKQVHAFVRNLFTD